jgi:prepilin-type N-terminal cleavage/methylation domain-containing protein
VRRRAHTDERGFTLTEVVVTVTILGLIAVPLCASLLQAVKIAPETSARATRAQDRQFLADSFATDTGRAVSVTMFHPSSQTAIDISSTGSATRTLPCTAFAGAKKLFTLSVASLKFPDEASAPGNDYLYDQHDVTYSAEITTTGEITSVKITRTDSIPDTVTVGYCTANAPNVITYATATKSCALACTLQHQSIDMNLKIQPQAQDPVEQVEFEGAIAKSTGTAPA